MQRSPGLGVQPAALVKQRNLDVFNDRVLRQQVVRLKNEADVAAAHLRQLIVIHLGDVVRPKKVLAARAPVQAAEQVQEGGLSRTGRSHQGDEISFLEFQAYTADRWNYHLIHLVVFDQVNNAGNGGHGAYSAG